MPPPVSPRTIPYLLHLRDAQQRFGISTELLDQLVQGTMLDLTAPASGRGAHDLSDLRRSVSLLLSRGLRRRVGVHSNFRLYRFARGSCWRSRLALHFS